MRLLILSDLFSLDSWLIHDEEPVIMPAVYEFFNHLGRSEEHSFDCIMFHQTARAKKTFPNGSAIQVHPLSIPFHYPRKFISLFAMRGMAQRMIARQSYDVIYGMSIYSTVAARLGHKNKILSVSRIFGSLIYDVMQKKQSLKLYTRHILQYAEAKYPCDIIICTEDGTQFDKALEIINPGQRVHMLYNGINDQLRAQLLSFERVKEIKRNQKIKLISIGRLTKWKRHDLSIRTLFELVHTHKVDASLCIIGSGELRQQLRKLVDTLSLQEHVKFKEGIAHHDMPSEILNYDIGLFLYDASNLGNALWETALSGRLLVVRGTGKTGDLFQHLTNALVVTDDPVEIANSIIEILDQDISRMTDQSSAMIKELLPSWQDRIVLEMDIIRDALKRT